MKYAEEEGLRFFELSCKTDEGINEFIDDLVHNIVKQQQNIYTINFNIYLLKFLIINEV